MKDQFERRKARSEVILEWASTCQDAEENEGRPNVTGLGANGFTIEGQELPFEIPAPVILCFRFDRSDVPGTVLGLNYRVVGPDGTVSATDRTGIEWNPGTAPQVIDPERIIRVFTIPMLIQGAGQHTIEVWTDGNEAIKLPYAFSIWNL